MKKTFMFPLALVLTLPWNSSLAQTQDYVADQIFTQGVEGPAVDALGNLYAVNFAKEGTIGIIDKKDNAQLLA
jgi:gluconolactonase